MEQDYIIHEYGMFEVAIKNNDEESKFKTYTIIPNYAQNTVLVIKGHLTPNQLEKGYVLPYPFDHKDLVIAELVKDLDEAAESYDLLNTAIKVVWEKAKDVMKEQHGWEKIDDIDNCISCRAYVIDVIPEQHFFIITNYFPDPYYKIDIMATNEETTWKDLVISGLITADSKQRLFYNAKMILDETDRKFATKEKDIERER